MKTDSVNRLSVASASPLMAPAIEMHASPFLAQGFRIQKIEKGRVVLTKRIRHHGSVLILVVVLLVLLALMGTAYLTTTRVDRYSADQNRENAKNGLIVDGVMQTVLARLESTNMPANFRDGRWLAARNPEALGTPVTALAWPSVALPLTTGPLQFVSPFGPAASAFPSGVLSNANKDVYHFEPTFVTVGGTNYPALRLVDRTGARVDWDGTTAYAAGRAFIAADTDGDGLADAGYSPFQEPPNPPLDGLTYYTAVRVIDNNSALNVNTAWEQTDFTGNGTTLLPNQGLFPASIGLNEMLQTYTAPATPTLTNQGAESLSLNTYRGASAQTGIVGGAGSPVNDAGAARADFQFMSQADALTSQLGRRVDYPGNAGYQAFPLSAQLSLSYPFAIRSASASQTALDTSLSNSLWGTRTTPYDASVAGDVANWYRDHFDWSNELGDATPVNRPRQAIRTYLATRNPVSNRVVFKDYSATPPAVLTAPAVLTGMLAFDAHTTKADANNSDFVTLWRAYWAAMHDHYTNAGGAAAGAPTDPMFATSPIRNTAPILSAEEVRGLRAGLAAANTIALREGTAAIASDIVPSFAVPLDTAGTHQAVVYGLKRQTFVTQCIYERMVDAADNLVWPDGTAKGATAYPGYLAVELYNPNPAGTVDLTNYRVVQWDRATNTMTIRAITAALPLTLPATIAPGSRIVLEDGVRPPGMPTPAGVNFYQVPGMLLAAGQELLVMRTRDITTGAGMGTMPPLGLAYDERLGIDSDGDSVPDDKNIRNWVPVDEIDLTNINPATLQANAPTTLLHSTVPDTNDASVLYNVPNRDRFTYYRPSGAGNPWLCVYGGELDPAKHQTFSPTSTDESSAALAPKAHRGATDTANPPTVSLLTYDADATQTLGTAQAVHLPVAPNYSIEVNPFGQVGPNPWQTTGTVKQFPFGGFARNGDLLQVPFIGSYKVIDPATGNTLELNGPSLDSIFAAVPAAGVTQAVGRFWPDPLNYNPATRRFTYYDWCKFLFDYVTVQSPQNDYMPNVPPTPVTGSNYATVTGGPAPLPVQNNPITVPLQPNGAYEWNVGVNGLVNINTASWKVLSMLPLVVDATGKVDNAGPAYNNDTMAKAIVAYRNANGPYTSLFDLNNIPANYLGAGTNLAFQNPTGIADDAPHGELMPAGGDATFRQGALQISRLSNLVTTHSDTFTVYVLVQGWRNGGTPAATLEVSKRACYILDRADPANPVLTPVPIH